MNHTSEHIAFLRKVKAMRLAQIEYVAAKKKHIHDEATMKRMLKAQTEVDTEIKAYFEELNKAKTATLFDTPAISEIPTPR